MAKILVHFSEDGFYHNDPCDCSQNEEYPEDNIFTYAYVDVDKYNDWVETLKHLYELKRYFNEIEDEAERNKNGGLESK